VNGADLTVVGLPTAQRFRAGDDLVEALLAAARDRGIALEDGDVVAVASKVVSLVEDAVVAMPPGDARTARQQLAREQAAAIVAESPWVVVTRTPHGFVAANGGIDASNVADGTALLLPANPDASAERLRQTIADRVGVHVGIIVTDTFGRAWRHGQTDVALGVAGLPALRDERGGHDLDGQPLEVTEAAVADELAGIADVVRTKASGTPFVVIRATDGLGVAPVTDGPGAHGPHGPDTGGPDTGGPDTSGPGGAEPGGGAPGGNVPGDAHAMTGQALVRDPASDLFATGGSTAPAAAVAARRTVRRLDPDRSVPTEALTAAVAAAVTAPAPHGSRPWRFVRLTEPRRGEVLDAMAARWRTDLTGDGVDDATIDRRIARSDAILRVAPELLLAFVALDASHTYPDERRRRGERDLFVLSGGAALQNLMVVLAGHGLGSAWISSTAFCPDTVRRALALPDHWSPIGAVAIGWPTGERPGPRTPPDLTDVLVER
jgi:coenzyme F420-0:L-glutamate ligase / coenzyme F420-1:gamma-L-glutamate ligase